MKKHGFLTFLLMVILLLPSCKKDVQKKTIAFLFPHEARSQIWQNFVNAAKEEYSDTTRYSLHFYQCDVGPQPFFENRVYDYNFMPQVQRAMSRMRREKVEPDLIVTYGDLIAHAAAQYDDAYLKEKPMICVAVTYPQWHDLLANMPNVVVVEDVPSVKENLDFIQKMGFSNYVVTEMDSTYLDDHLRDCIMEQLGNEPMKYRPNLHLEQEDRIHSRDKRDPRITLVPISIMWPEKNDHHPWIAGSLKLDWVFNTQQQSTSYLHIKDDPYSHTVMSYHIGPYFTMTPEYFDLPLVNALNQCMGGYFAPYFSVLKQIHPLVDKILGGTDPKQIPWSRMEKDYWLDWRLVKSIHPYASDFPKGVKFVNLPLREKSRFINFLFYFMFFILFVLFIVYAIIVPLKLSRDQKRQRQKLMEKAREAKASQEKVEYTLANVEAYIWRLLPDRTLKFSPSFYKDFNIPEGTCLQYETLLDNVEEPGQSQLRNFFMIEDFEGETDYQLMVHIPGQEKARAIYMHTVILQETEYTRKTGYRPKAGFFYFNDEANKLNEELKEAYRRNEEISEKETFLATMNEEFKIPVDRILNNSRELAEKFNDLYPEQRERCVEEVMEANENVLSLLDQIMGDTIRSRNENQARISAVKVAELMEDVYVNHSVHVGEGIEFEMKHGPADSEIESNRAVISQVMNSLISKAFSNCTGKIEIGWAEHAGTEVVIYIDNTIDDIDSCKKLIESVGGNIAAIAYPGSPVRVEIAFSKALGGVNSAFNPAPTEL